MKLRDSENVFVLGGFLGITALISGLVLALVFQLTRKPVEAMELKSVQSSLKMLNLPQFDNNPQAEERRFLSPAGFPATVLPVRKKGKIVAFAVKCASPNGYAGDVEITAGFTPSGKITAVLVTRHRETPGLGSNVCERKFTKTIFNIFKPLPPGLPPNRVLDRFNGLSVPAEGSWKVKRDGGEFDFITGATITSRAVLEAVEQAGKTLALRKNEFIKGDRR